MLGVYVDGVYTIGDGVRVVHGLCIQSQVY